MAEGEGQQQEAVEDSMDPLQKTVFGLVIVAILALLGILVSGNRPAQNLTSKQAEVAALETAQQVEQLEVEEEVMTEQSELLIEDKVVGTGAEVKVGDTVTVNYIGTLTDGTKFDSSLDEGREPFAFTVGESSVIEGWHVGLVGMRVGGARVLTIPPGMAYGDVSPSPLIPPNSTLLFEIQLISVESKQEVSPNNGE